MPYDEYERLFEKCIHCGMHTIWKIDGVPVCRSCAKVLESGPDPAGEQVGGVEAGRS